LNICNLNSCKTVSSSTIKNKKSKFQTIFSKLEDTLTDFIAIPLPELTIFLFFFVSFLNFSWYDWYLCYLQVQTNDKSCNVFYLLSKLSRNFLIICYLCGFI
jgi:hypothetical protein